MEDKPTTRTFLNKLPVILSFRDFAGGEKMGDAPNGGTTKNALEVFDSKLAMLPTMNHRRL